MKTPRHHKLFASASYDRYLDVALDMWPKIKEAVPDAEFHFAYGWKLFDMATINNKERQAWKAKLEKLIKQPGVFHYGRVGRDKLWEIRSQCGVYFYPTYFTEISCMSALESQADGLVPVTMTLGALSETAKAGILIDGRIHKQSVREEFVEKLTGLMKDKKEWKRLSNKCKKFSVKYSWENVSQQWIDVFVKDVD